MISTKFKTKAYTRPLLVKEIKSLRKGSFKSIESFTAALSPIKGSKSAKNFFLEKHLAFTLEYVFKGGAAINMVYGKTFRSRILNILQAKSKRLF